MFLTDFIEKVARVSKALTTKSPAYGHDFRYEAAHHPARYRGQHRVDYETCIGCDSCNKICPVNAITMKHLPFKKQNIVPEVNLSVCIFCGLCEDVCPTKPDKAIKLSGGRYDMLTGGWHEDQDDFWVHVNIPEEYIKSRLEAEEAARIAKEMKKKKMEAEKRKKEAAAAAAASSTDQPTDQATGQSNASDGQLDFLNEQVENRATEQPVKPSVSSEELGVRSEEQKSESSTEQPSNRATEQLKKDNAKKQASNVKRQTSTSNDQSSTPNAKKQTSNVKRRTTKNNPKPSPKGGKK